MNRLDIKTIIDCGLECFVINDRYWMYSDGVVYDTLKAKDIPQYVFNLREILL
jgi:hypothetical protein